MKNIQDQLHELSQCLAEIVQNPDCPIPLYNAIMDFSCAMQDHGDGGEKLAANLRGPALVGMLSLVDSLAGDQTEEVVSPAA